MIEKSIIMKRTEDKKHSITYKPDREMANPVLTSIYLMRTFSKTMPECIRVTVKEVKEVEVKER